MVGRTRWSRKDSSVAFIFDADGQIVFQSAAPIAENAQLLYLIDLFTKKSTIAGDDVDAVGSSFFPVSETGRELDRALNIIWARLRRGAKLPVMRK